MKRKCMFSYYVPGERPVKDGKAVMGQWMPGTNCYTEPREGIFHQWGMEGCEVGETTSTNTVAIVEDPADGKCYMVQVNKIQFVNNHEYRLQQNFPVSGDWIKDMEKSK